MHKKTVKNTPMHATSEMLVSRFTITKQQAIASLELETFVSDFSERCPATDRSDSNFDKKPCSTEDESLATREDPKIVAS